MMTHQVPPGSQAKATSGTASGTAQHLLKLTQCSATGTSPCTGMKGDRSPWESEPNHAGRKHS